MRVWFWAAGVALFLVTGSDARADLIVTVGPAQLSPGGTATADVFVRSTTGTDVLDNVSLKFLLTTAGPVAGVSFANPQSDAHLSDPGYVLSGDSQAAAFGTFTAVGTTTGPDDTYFGGDGTVSGLGVTVPTTDVLLARLDLRASAGAAGATYRLTLVDDGFTAFNDPAFNPVGFLASGGTVSVLGAGTTAVPEPLTLFTLGLALAGVATRTGFRATARLSRG